MALCNESHIKNDIKLSNIAPCYIIFGNDGYLKNKNAENIIKAVVDTDDIFNFQKFVGECSMQEVYDAKEQLPLMADKKCILIKDYDFLGCSQEDFEILLKICGEKSDECVVVFLLCNIEVDVKKQPERLKALISAIDKISGKAVLINHRQTGELVRMVLSACEKRGCTMRSDTARFFIEYVSDDIDTIMNELEKVCAYKAGGTIDNETVKKVCVRNIDQSIYDLSAKILRQDVSGALNLLDELLYMRIKPIALLSAISGVYVDLSRALAAKKASLKAEDVINDFGYKGREFVVERTMKTLSNFTEKQVNLSLNELCAADSKIKGFSGDDRIVLEELIVRLSYIASKGESID